MNQPAYLKKPLPASAALARLIRHLHACRTQEDVAAFNNATIARRAKLDVDGRAMLEAAIYAKSDAIKLGKGVVR